MNTSQEQEPNPQRRRRRRKSQLLEASKKVFAEHGYHAASVSHIVEEAGVARGTFYSYFDSKHAVLDFILNEALRELTALIRGVEVGEGAPSPNEQIRDNLQRVFEYLLHDRNLAEVLLVRVPGAEPEITAKVNAFNESVLRLTETGLKIGMQLGIIRSCNSALIASSVVGAVRGALEELMKRQSIPIEGAVDEIVNMVLSGVSTELMSRK